MSPMTSIFRCARVVLAAGFVLGLMALPSSAAEEIKPGQTKAVEKIIRDYLIQNPEIIVKALDAYTKKQEQAEIDATSRTLAERRAELRRDPGSPVGGDPGGDVVVIEFFDYRCGVCRRVHPIVAELMRTDKKIRRVYKEWPILGPESVFAARAALASRRQGKYLAFHKALMDAKRTLTPAAIFKIAETVGIDSGRLEKDMEDPEITAILKRNYDLAEQLKLTGTPSFVIGDELLRGGRDLDGMRAIVDRQRRQG
jgi:protein-disulfide isomerase